MLLKCLLLLSVIGVVVPTRMTGYYTEWAHYRKGIWSFTTEKIDTTLYTHLIFAFATLNTSTYTIETGYNQEYYRNFTALRNVNPSIKLSISLGGAEGSRQDAYSTMAASPVLTKSFAESIVQFLDTYGFDGFDFDWQYQKQEDIAGFVSVIKALRAAFGTKYELTVAVHAGLYPGYDVPSIDAYVDAINLMTYDYHGPWLSGDLPYVVDHHAPLYRRPQEADATLNVDFTVNYWISRGASPSKLVLGIPMYGRDWILMDSNSTYPPTFGKLIEVGPVTQDPGAYAYFEICTKIKAGGWTVIQDPNMFIGPYAYSSGDPTKVIWVGYDDSTMAAHKTNYALEKGLGGVFVWDIGHDDFNNACDGGVNPIQTAIVEVLNRTSHTSTTTWASTLSTTPAVSTALPTSTTTKGSDFVCPAADGLVPSPTRCDAFYSCKDGVATLMYCPVPLYFNPSLTVCDWQYKVDCKV